jgi:formimidoylglutamate deiminase
LFPLRDFLDRGGRFGIGSDSNVSVSPVEELRWLEYGQRLSSRQRNIAASVDLPSTGESLVMRAVGGGRQSNGHGEQHDDMVLLDEHALALGGAAAVDIHDRFVFAGNRNLVRDVFVDGKRVIADGAHEHGERIANRYRSSLRGLLADS